MNENEAQPVAGQLDYTLKAISRSIPADITFNSLARFGVTFIIKNIMVL